MVINDECYDSTIRPKLPMDWRVAGYSFLWHSGPHKTYGP